MAESNLQIDVANSVYGRVEYVRKSGEELSLPDPLSEEDYDIGNLSLGYIREFAGYSGATFGAGARAAIILRPESLEEVYGSRTPVGLAVFLRVRPGLLEGAHETDPEMHHEQH